MPVFTDVPQEAVSSLKERGLITAIRGWLGAACPPAPFGIGDDCAVLPREKTEQVMTVDPVIYGRHFDDSLSARDVGSKLLKRNLSDIAAMGAEPTSAVIALALASTTSLAWLKDFYEGLAETAGQYGVKIVGGDVAQVNGAFVATLTLIGRCTAPRAVTRTGARVNDSIWVTGTLGGSILEHHYSFSPKLKEGAWLAQQPFVHSMMDVSDGLAKDLWSLTPPGTRPCVFEDSIPVSAAARRLARKSKKPAIVHALTDGEDYELLFTLDSRSDEAAFAKAWKSQFNGLLTRIGHFAPIDLPLPPGTRDIADLSGYEHLQ